MFSHILSKSGLSARQNLEWLFILRNLMITSEVILILISIHVLRIHLPQEQLWMVTMSIAAVNLYTWMRLQTDDPVTELEIFSQLVIDVFGITSLLYLTGGASNPIIWVFLVPLIITAITLPHSYAWYMVILTCSMYTILIAYNIPLPTIEPHMPAPEPELSDYEMLLKAHTISDKHYFNLHVFGMWLGFVFSAGLVAFFVVELAKSLKDQERSLADARENSLRDEKAVSLGTLAASAAHDMGTPLATIAICAHELEQDYPEHRYPDIQQKTQIIQQQLARCKQALSVMSASAGEMRAESGQAMLLIDYIDEIFNQWRSQKPETKLNFNISPQVDLEAKIIADRTLTHSFINILNNAADATPIDKGIDFQANWDLNEANIIIRDYGAGFPPDFNDFAGKKPIASNKSGLGVGLFLTNTAIKRLGGKISFYNKDTGGACVEITLPLLTTEDNHD